MTQTLEQIIARWDAGEGKPYKGKLIDWSAYDGDGEQPPANIGCMCAQGQVLHLLGGWEPKRLRSVEQREADRETAKLLGISVAHAILLRNVNDRVDGAPSVVLSAPERVLGDQAHIIFAFWRHLDRMTNEQWDAARGAAGDAAGGAAWGAAWVAAKVASEDAEAPLAARVAAKGAAKGAAWGAAWDAAWDAAAYACSEIQGARVLREQGKPFYFLPMFGFADPEAVLAADEAAAALRAHASAKP